MDNMIRRKSSTFSCLDVKNICFDPKVQEATDYLSYLNEKVNIKYNLYFQTKEKLTKNTICISDKKIQGC